MRRLSAFLKHLYCWLALAMAAYFVVDQIGYQHAVIYMMRAQAQAMFAIAALGHAT